MFEAYTKWKSSQKREIVGFTDKGEKENIFLVYQFWLVKLLPHSVSEAESPDWEYMFGCTIIQVVFCRDQWHILCDR